jgi:hypothetical protein
VGRHIDYLRDRNDGELEVETDDGRTLSGQGVTKDLIEDWDLELEARRRQSDLSARQGGSQKLVHKLLFSMPAGTPPGKVLDAVKNLAREEFGLKYRYAMVLHTDEPHPHVHMVLKAVSEQGARLHIRKQNLRHWREEFARHLRALSVEANATARAVRGETRQTKLDGIYRAIRRGESTHLRARTESVAAELLKGGLQRETGTRKLTETRRQVERGWHAAGKILKAQGQTELATQIQRFVNQIPPPLTEREIIANALITKKWKAPARTEKFTERTR